MATQSRSEPSLLDVLVTVDDRHLDDLESVARSLAEAGLTVETILELSGTVAGSVPADRLELLRAVKGVESVDEDAVFEIR